MQGGRVPGVALALALALGGGLAGCGSTARTSPVTSPDAAATACRAQWRTLGEKIQGQAARTQPSALPQRWSNLSATVDYFRTSATRADCGARLAGEQQAIAALEAFGARLAAYDVELRLATVRSAATTYAAGPAPAKPRKGVVAPAAVTAALATLTTQAPLATAQQGPAWQQASEVDLGDAAATAKAVRDLQFLSSQSPAYVASSAALATIAAALRTR